MDSTLTIYNSLSRRKEAFDPIKDNKVGIYTCGPTIYDYPHIGNWRTYVLSDLLVRTLSLLGYDVTHVMNLTDVGHLSGDNLGDPSQGEDRMSKASEREGLDAWAISNKYAKDFLDSFDLISIKKPNVIAKATDHIDEQIALIKKIEEKGLVYRISDGVYFDVDKYEKQGNKYGELSTIDQLHKEGSRIEENPEKKDPRDFALWKFFATGQKRHNMQWDSPWGEGFPGWHIECSAMSMKYLGDQFDIHVGGEDLRSTHHPNEIAQSEAVTGAKPFVKYWVHGAFLTVDGGKMGKSLGNAYTIHDVVKKGFHPLALRYFYLTGHYRKQINFTWEALEGAENALRSLWKIGNRVSSKSGDETPSDAAIESWKKFLEAITDDLNMPQALAALSTGLDSAENDSDIIFLLDSADKVLGLDLLNPPVDIGGDIVDKKDLPDDIQSLVKERQELREVGKYDEADVIRDKLRELGYDIRDLEQDALIFRI